MKTTFLLIASLTVVIPALAQDALGEDDQGTLFAALAITSHLAGS